MPKAKYMMSDGGMVSTKGVMRKAVKPAVKMKKKV